jgi:hypothetical protein
MYKVYTDMSGRMKRSHRGGRKRHHRKSMHGKGIMSFLSRANNFLRKHKILSTVGNALSGIHPGIGHAAKAASLLGYGRRRHSRRGGALRLAGAGLGLAGGRRRHHRRRM